MCTEEAASCSTGSRGYVGYRPGQGSTATATVGGLHAVAAPLRARISLDSGSEYLGVVSIARGEREFSDSERGLFAYLAAQAAVSIENSFIPERARRQAVTDDSPGSPTRGVSRRP